MFDLPSGRPSLTFGLLFNQSSEKLALPSGLQSLTFNASLNQSLEKVSLPSGLLSLTFDLMFDQSLEKVAQPYLQRMVKPELREGDSAKRPAALDLGPDVFCQSLGKDDSTMRPAEFDLWTQVCTRAWRRWLCQSICKVCPLALVSTRAW